MDDLPFKLMLYFILVGSLSVHEWAHAYMAYRLGDNTAERAGRLTLNPFAHIDVIGTVILPLFMLLASPGFAVIGWAKPVPFDPRNLKNRALGDILISMAGPASNLLICLGVSVIGGGVLRILPDVGPLFGFVIWINAILMLFNLIPIPPLDGSHVLKQVVRMREETYIRFAQWGFIMLLILINIPQFRHGLFIAIRFVFALFAILGGAIAGVAPESFFPSY